MSDEHEWKPPVFTEGTTAGTFVPPANGAPAPVAPSYGPPGAAAPVTASWTAPPKPGLIPLRPLTLGNILAASFQILRRNPRPTFGFAFAVQSIIMVVTLVIVGLVSFASLSRVFTASVEDMDEIGAGALVITMLSTLIPGLFSVVALALVQGILMLEIQRATVGEKLKLTQWWRRARGRLGALVGWMLLMTAAMLVAIALLVGIIVLLVALGAVGIALAVVVGIFGGLALLVGVVWLGTKLSLVPSVLMGERLKLADAVRRSWSLVDGYFWRTFGIQVLVSVILGMAVQMVSVPAQFIAPMAMFLIDPNGTGNPVAFAVFIGLSLLSILVILVMSSVALVVQSATTALIYIDLRMRKEGLDLDLARYVEETSVGNAQANDPYLVHDGPVPAAPMTHAYAPPSDSPWS